MSAEPNFLSDPEVHRDMARRAVEAAVDYLFEVTPAAFANQIVEDARNSAPRLFDQRRSAKRG